MKIVSRRATNPANIRDSQGQEKPQAPANEPFHRGKNTLEEIQAQRSKVASFWGIVELRRE